jgi:hypothetical protein
MKTFHKILLMLVVGIVVGMLWPQKDSTAQSNFVIPSDVARRYPSNIRPYPTYIDARVLAPGVSETHTMPANTRFVIFSANCDFYAQSGASAAVPAADVTNGTASELNPAAWYFNTPPTQITVISPVACVLTMAVYLGPTL